MQKYLLQAQKRALFGRKVKKLRRDGILPANIFGKKIKSQAVQVAARDFAKIYSQAGETLLVDLELDSKKMPVLINNVTLHPVSSLPLHVDFHQVDLKEKVATDVPLEVVGASPAVKDKLGVLLTNLNEVEVEALPQDLPGKIEVDVSYLKAVGEAVKIKDLKVSGDVRILTDPELEVVKIAPLVSKEAEKMVEEQAAAAAQTAAQATVPASGTTAEVVPPQVKEEPNKKATEQPQKPD